MARPAKFDEVTLVDRAMVAFWEQGFSNTSIRDLEQAMQITAPSIYRRFGDKHQLFEQCLNRYLSRVIDGRISKFLPDTAPLKRRAAVPDTTPPQPIQALRQFFDSGIDPGPHGRPLIGCLVANSSVEATVLTNEARLLIVSGVERVRSAFERQARLAIMAGDISSDRPQAVASRLQLDFFGLMVLARSGLTIDKLKERVGHVFEDLES